MIDALAWVHIHNRQVLAVRSCGKDAFYLPGGKRESGETDWQALAREVQEELQVTLLAETFVPWGVWVAPAHSYPAGTTVTLRCYQADYQGDLQPGAEIEELAWLNWIHRHQCAPASAKVMQALYIEGLID
jgi:8-oxo-dGTP pyrophosphatase MutT (NUDIX family)